MKKKMKESVPVETRGMFGQKKNRHKKRTLEAHRKAHRELKHDIRNCPYSLEELLFYDDIIFDEF